MSGESQHELLLQNINETQKFLDKIVIHIDKNRVSEEAVESIGSHIETSLDSVINAHYMLTEVYSEED